MSETNRLGESIKANNGLMMTIIAYRNSHDIDIQFEDGTIVTHKKYYNFSKGLIKNPNKIVQSRFPIATRLGETLKMNCGLYATIVVYRNTHDIDVQFENGEIVTHKSYDKFIKKSISPGERNGHYYITKNCYMGKTKKMNNGLYATVIDYRSHTDIDIQFETGYITKHKKNYNFKIGKIGHPFPYQMGTIIIHNLAYIYNETGNFYCTCAKCGYKDILTMDEIKNHKCIERKE